MALAPLTLTEKVQDSAAVQSTVFLPPSTVPLQLLLDWPWERSRPQWLRIIAVSLFLHLLLFVGAIQMPSFIRMDEPSHRVAVRRVPLYLPPDVLTQREPNRQKVSKTIDLADLQPTQARRPQEGSAAPKARQVAPAKAQQIVPEQIRPEAPKVALNPTTPPQKPQQLPSGLASVQPPAAAPPPLPASASATPGPFQNIAPPTSPNPNPTLIPPKSPLQASPKELAQTVPAPGRRAPTDNDDGVTEAAPRVPGSLGQPSVPHAAVELQSDPQGADFKPYLTQILAIVRANWRRVVPESARTGALRGKTVMEFIINRDGSIPKIVTADPSGSDALDRAALVGLSMSNPLPPLPADFKGFQVRLAFTFSYNLTAQQQ